MNEGVPLPKPPVHLEGSDEFKLTPEELERLGSAMDPELAEAVLNRIAAYYNAAPLAEKKSQEDEGDVPEPKALAIKIISNNGSAGLPRLTKDDGFSGMPESSRKVYELCLDAMYRFLDAPYVVDTFDHHPHRRVFGTQFILNKGKQLVVKDPRPNNGDPLQPLFDYWRKNRLSLNTITMLQSTFTNLARISQGLECTEAVFIKTAYENRGKPATQGEIFLPHFMSDEDSRWYRLSNTPKDIEKKKDVYIEPYVRACRKLLELINESRLKKLSEDQN